MKRLIIAGALVSLAGCSGADETAAGMRAFIEACQVPVSGKLVLGNFGNTLELNCPNFKPIAKSSKGTT